MGTIYQRRQGGQTEEENRPAHEMGVAGQAKMLSREDHLQSHLRFIHSVKRRGKLRNRESGKIANFELMDLGETRFSFLLGRGH